MGIVMDKRKNEISVTRNAETEITGNGSKVRIFVIPTDEELVMTEDTYALMAGDLRRPHELHLLLPDPRYVNKARAEQLSTSWPRRRPCRGHREAALAPVRAPVARGAPKTRLCETEGRQAEGRKEAGRQGEGRKAEDSEAKGPPPPPPPPPARRTAAKRKRR